jgi:hypothetical protein
MVGEIRFPLAIWHLLGLRLKMIDKPLELRYYPCYLGKITVREK